MLKISSLNFKVNEEEKIRVSNVSFKNEGTKNVHLLNCLLETSTTLNEILIVQYIF